MPKYSALKNKADKSNNCIRFYKILILQKWDRYKTWQMHSKQLEVSFKHKNKTGWMKNKNLKEKFKN